LLAVQPAVCVVHGCVVLAVLAVGVLAVGVVGAAAVLGRMCSAAYLAV
jgi:hypothetical protein